MYLVRHWNPLGHILAALSFCGLVVGCGDERISADRLSADRPQRWSARAACPPPASWADTGRCLGR